MSTDYWTTKAYEEIKFTDLTDTFIKHSARYPKWKN